MNIEHKQLIAPALSGIHRRINLNCCQRLEKKTWKKREHAYVKVIAKIISKTFSGQI